MWPFSKFRRLEADLEATRFELACTRSELDDAEAAFLTLWAELVCRSAKGRDQLVTEMADQLGLRVETLQ